MASKEAVKQNDPAERLLRKELYETIRALLHCLNRKERGIFEAYFFQQLSPDEIATMYHTTTGTVYTYLHRSRQKLRQTHLRATLGLHESKGGGCMSKQKVIQLPEWQRHYSAKMSFVDRIGHMLATLGDIRPTSELMGISGFAFRMKISNRTTFSDGIYVFDWRKVFRGLMDKLGYDASVVCGQLSNGPVPLLSAAERFPVVLPIEEAVLPFIRKYIDMGKPLLYFDTLADRPYVHEWALIYGYDDERRIAYVTDAMRENGKTVSYKEIAENPLRFLAGINGRKEDLSDQSDKLTVMERNKQAIKFAVNYARNGCDYVPMTTYLNYTSGLATYDRWILYLHNPEVAPNRYGIGQLAAVYADAKHQAARYLRGVQLQGESMRLTLLAAEAYEQAAEALDNISGEVPFVRSSEPLVSETLHKCREQLEKAKEFETAAIGYLENAIKRWGGEE
jgi:predicted DNA-binding protein YlxM (UPF0122 family)